MGVKEPDERRKAYAKHQRAMARNAALREQYAAKKKVKAEKDFDEIVKEVAKKVGVPLAPRLSAVHTDTYLVKIQSNDGFTYYLSLDEAVVLGREISNAIHKLQSFRAEKKQRHHPEMERALKQPKRR